MKKLIFTFSILFIIAQSLSAQIINVKPVFPSVDDTVTITYDATKGSGGLVGVAPVYIHTGLITDQSSDPSDWKHVPTDWGTADPDAEMTNLGNDLHRISYHIKSYHGVPASDSVEQMAFVFRNADGSLEGKTEQNENIYYSVYPESGLFTTFIQPTEESGIYELGEQMQIEAAANKNVTLTLYEDGQQLTQVNDDSLGYTLTMNERGSHMLVLEADDGNQVVRDTAYYIINNEITIQDPPANTENGINYINDSTVILQLTAPGKEFAYVLGDFNDWQADTNYFMNVSNNSTKFWLEITGLKPGQEYAYQYYVDDEVRIGDPYADKVLDPWHDQYIPNSVYPNLKSYPDGKTDHVVSVLETGQTPYQWDVTNFNKPKKTDLVIYELLVRDFSQRGDYQTVIDSLDYLENLGINCIELMPIMEFEGNVSWGYNPSFFFAPDKAYGTKNDLKRLIDSCHKRGIAVVLDMVLNHAYGQNSLVRLWWNSAQGQPAANSPYFNEIPKHDFNVGFDFNHQSSYTREFSKDVMEYWLEEYKFDGYRFDLSKGFTQKNTLGDVGAWGQYDQSRIDIWKDYSQFMWSVDPDAYVILEHFAENSEEKALSDNGMMLWGNINHNFNELTMGYLGSSDFSWASYQNRGWSDPNVVAYMESHDEERLMFKNLEFGNSQGSYDITELPTALDRQEMAGVLFYTIPGPKMLWQFGEYGYDISIEQNGRTGPKPIKWNYLDNPDRLELYKVWSALINLRTKEPAFETNNFDIKGGGAIKRVRLHHGSMSVVALANADVTSQSADPNFPHTGWWYDYFSGDSMNVTDVNQAIQLEAGEYHLYTDKHLETPDTDVPVSVVTAEEPATIQVYPNPATEMVNINGSLDQAGNVKVEILDLNGQRIVQDVRSHQAGHFQIQWNTNNASGQPVPAGTYLIQLTFDEKAITKKVMITR